MSSPPADKPILIFGYGNPSRGDDAIGPEFLKLLEARRDTSTIPDRFDTLTDFQLQIEHALDLRDRDQVLFVDANVSIEQPFQISRLAAIRDDSFSTHALTPSAVLNVYEEMFSSPAPESFLLSIRGYHFELGAPIGERTLDNMGRALDMLSVQLKSGRIGPNSS